MTLEDVLREYDVDFITSGHHHCRPGYLQSDCPNCSPDWKHYRLGWNVRINRPSCWACGRLRSGETLAAQTGLPLNKCLGILKALGTDDCLPQLKEPLGKLVLPTSIGPLLKPHRDFLTRRGFDPDEIAAVWGVKGIGLHHKYPWRVFIPIVHRGEVVSWTLRKLVDEGTRYRSAGRDEEKLPAKNLLYGEPLTGHAVCVTEGPLDAWAVGPGGVATLGLKITEAQVRRIARFPLRIIALDAQPEGQARARKLCRELATQPGETVNVVLESGKDPSRCNKRELNRLRRMLK